jgi:acyl-CoA thioesterase
MHNGRETVDGIDFDHEDVARGKAAILLLLVYALKPQFSSVRSAAIPDSVSIMHKDSQLLAEAAAAALYPRDRASHALGIKLLGVGPGSASMQMAVREDMANVHNTCHGGLIFTLADSAFAYACNSHNKNAVAVTCVIEYMRPAFVGDVLTASGSEQGLEGRNGVYDIRVENQKGELVALFRGKSTQIKGEVTELNKH